jgi:hypothetical protein
VSKYRADELKIWGYVMIAKRFQLALVAMAGLYGSSAQAAITVLPDPLYVVGWGGQPNPLTSNQPINVSGPSWSVGQAAVPNPSVSISTTDYSDTNSQFDSEVIYSFEIVSRSGTEAQSPVRASISGTVTLNNFGGPVFIDAQVFLHQGAVSDDELVDLRCGGDDPNFC